MKKLFVIGGMGAGKSSASQALASQGIPLIDLDKVGHEVLKWDSVKEDLRTAFGADIFDDQGEVIRSALAAVAFASTHNTHKLNNITMSRIEQAYVDLCAEYAKTSDYLVVEYSAFKGKENSLASDADCIIAVTAPVEQRVARAVARGWDEQDVRNRIAQQITDAARIEAADVVFANEGTPEDLRDQVISWWSSYKAQEGK